jgi:aryl-alcohol dehydrogenase-like predicted oxidoreductase
MQTISNGPPLDRRRFLAAGLAACAGAASVGERPAAADDGKAAPAALPVRPFGKTGLRLPVLAFGGSAMVEKWSATYGPQLPFERRVALVRHAFEAGIRYFDTSPNYGESEAIIGEALRDVRGQIYLSTKVGVPRSDDAILKPGDVRASLEKSLQTLRTDRADCVQLHGPVFEYSGVAAARLIEKELVRLRDEKLFRFLGVTGHTAFESMHRLIDTGLYDQALIAYGHFPKGMDTILSHENLAWRERCLDRARELGMGVVAMKVLGSFLLGSRAARIAPGWPPERLARLREAALRWALRDERVTLAVVGVTRPEEIDRNAAALSGGIRYGGDDGRILAEFSTEAFRSPVVREMKVA